MKKALALLLVLLMVVCMAACGEKKEEPAAAAPAAPAEEKKAEASAAAPAASAAEPAKEVKYVEHLIYGDGSAITEMDPHGASNEVNDRFRQHVFETLVVYNTTTKTIEPKLATEWKYADDYQSISFKLRDDVYFHNGDKMTAEDVKYSLLDSTKSTFVGEIDHIDVASDTELTVFLNKVDTEFINQLCFQLAGITCKAAEEKDPENGYMYGTGPWVIDAKNCLAGDVTELVRNENYWGELPKTKRLTFKVIATGSSRLIALQNKEIHMMGNVPLNEMADAQADKSIVVTPYPSTGLRYLSFNTMEGMPGSDENLRLCLKHLVNREDIMALCGDFNGKATDSLFGWTAPAYNGGFTENSVGEYDLEKAKEYLEKSKYKELSILSCTGTAYYPVAEILQEEGRKIGLTINVVDTDGAGMGAATKYSSPQNESVVYSIGLKDFNSDISRLVMPGSNSNKSIIDNAEINEMLKKGVSTTNQDEVNAAYGRIQEIVYENTYYVPLYYGSNSFACQKGVEGYAIDPGNRHNLSYAYMIEQ